MSEKSILMMKNIAICVIAYNRLHSLKRVISSLQDAYYSHPVELIISIDKSETNEVAEFAEAFVWTYGTKRVIAHKENLGLRKHVFSCGDLLDEYDALVVLEDDITVAPSFFMYTEQCVDKYWDDDQIAGISLYRFPLSYHNLLPFIPLQSDSDVFLQQTAQSWGQVWMKKQWKTFRKWYELNCEEFQEMPHLPKSICSWPKSSWLKYHSRYCIEQNKYFVYPYVSLSTNHTDAGTHALQSSTHFQSSLLYGLKQDFKLNPIVKYDGFFENELLYETLSLSSAELCIDLYGDKGNRENKRFWLTCKVMPYFVVNSFALENKPFELNVLNHVEGSELFLYDTTKICKNEIRTNAVNIFNYFYGGTIGTRKLFKMLINSLLNKLIRSAYH